MAHNWVRMTPDSPIPSFAVIGEPDRNGDGPTYVGRSFHEGGTFPARVISKKHYSYVSWGGSEIKKTDYEILVGENYRFVKYFADGIPFCAVRAGNTANGDPLWVGRGDLDGIQIIGKIHPIHQCLFVAFDGEEHRLDSFEILIRDPTDGEKGNFMGNVHRLSTDNLKLVNFIPSKAAVVPSGEKNDSSVVEPPESHIWVPSSWGNIPPNAVFAGNDSDGSTIYVGRAHHEGEILPAKVIPRKTICYVSFGGLDIFKTEFEVLVGDGYSWVKGAHSGNNIPNGAVSTGYTRNGKPVYVGRGPHVGSITPGKVHPGEYCVYIPFYQKEHKIHDYEILVKKIKQSNAPNFNFFIETYNKTQNKRLK